jgi:NAD-dependent deacetylase
MLVIGTSANVYPAAEMPLLTLHSGGRVLEINLEKTPLTHKVAELTIFAPADEVLPEILRQLQNG